MNNEKIKRQWIPWTEQDKTVFKDCMLRFHKDFDEYLPYFVGRTKTQIKGFYHNLEYKKQQDKKQQNKQHQRERLFKQEQSVGEMSNKDHIRSSSNSIQICDVPRDKGYQAELMDNVPFQFDLWQAAFE